MALPMVRRKKDLYSLTRGSKDDIGDIRASPMGRNASTGKLGLKPARRHTMEPIFVDDPLGLNLSPSSAAMAPSTVLGEGRASFLKGLAGDTARTKRPYDTSECWCCQLALRHRLSLSEVKSIVKEFQAAPKTADGLIQRKDFNKVMCRIFDVDVVDENVAKNAFELSGFHNRMDIEKFLEWYVQNMFTQVNGMNCAKDKVASEKMVYKIAEKHQVSTMVVDKVKVKFDYYDTDKSGHICFKEFTAMFCAILKTKSTEDLNPDRLRRFWSEIDTNGDEGVDFEEFCDWYLKYFAADDDDPDNWDMAGPLRAFYDSYDPRVQRRNSLNGGVTKLASIN
jgi:Ca2+-binding EF-hand superfamily protein